MFAGGMLVLGAGICFAQTPPAPAAGGEPVAQPHACLASLETNEVDNLGGAPGLGRVFWQNQLIEPVLIWKTLEQEYRFRDCSGGKPVVRPIDEPDKEMYKSALVARFQQEETGVMETFRGNPGLGYAPEGEARLRFRGPGSMLEARRTDDAYIEVVATDSANRLGEGIAVLLVTTRDAMVNMDPEVWDEPWGERSIDSKIGREIVWWEWVDPEKLRIHSAVRSFGELADLAGKPSGANEARWRDVVEEESEAILARAAYSLIVVDRPGQADLAEEMSARANNVNSADLDIAKVEKKKKADKDDGWDKPKRDLKRLEETATSGEFLLLTGLYELTAVMPDRIAVRTRKAYRASLRSAESGKGFDNRFRKDNLILAAASAEYQIVNALYQDQAASMARTMSFLRCLLKDDAHEAPERLEALEQGLERAHLPFEKLREGTEVREAFRYFFQGLSLPTDLRGGDRLFLGSIRRTDPVLRELVESLQAYLGASLNTDASCKVVPIPDAALLGSWEEKMTLVSPMPTAPPQSAPDNALYAEARKAKGNALRAFERAIVVKGARHTQELMIDGHAALVKGDGHLDKGGGVNEIELKQAIEKFREAESIFGEARDTAHERERSLPYIRSF